MSRLSSSIERPFSKTIQWKNEKFDKKTKTVTREKGWYFYEKFEAEIDGKKGQDVMVEMPFTFVWLSSGTSFSGYNEAEKKSVFSNEVLSERHLKELFKREAGEGIEEYNQRIKSYQVLTVKMGKDEIAKGFYADIKPNVTSKSVGGKYCQPNYALLVTNEGTEIVRILMSGSSVETWIPFVDQNKLKNNAVSCNGSVDKQKGANDYCSPTFTYVPATKELLKEADAAAAKVDEYFKYVLSNVEQAEPVAAGNEHADSEEDYTS